MLKLIEKFIQKKNKPKRYSCEEKQQMVFEKKAREQFLRLKEKGLGITIMSL